MSIEPRIAAAAEKISKICILVDSRQHERAVLDCETGRTTDHFAFLNIELGVDRTDFFSALGSPNKTLDTLERKKLFTLWQKFQLNGLVLAASASAADLEKLEEAFAVLNDDHDYLQYEQSGYSYFIEDSLSLPRIRRRYFGKKGELVIFHDRSADLDVSVVYSEHLNVNKVAPFFLFTIIIWS
jgi:hypothetical protein